MKPVVLDTDVVSFLQEIQPSAILPATPSRPVMADLLHDGSGIGAMGAPVKLACEADRLAANLSRAIRYCMISSSKWAEVMVVARRAGRRLETADAWIAATAMLYEEPLITHNASDYLGVPGLKVITDASS